MIRKLKELGAKKCATPKDAKETAFSEFENVVGHLPETYKYILDHFVGDIEFDDIVLFHPDVLSPWSSEDGTESVEILYGLVSKYGMSLLEIYDTYKDRIPTNWIPIGAAPGGNQICMYVGGGRESSIGFWDHESEGSSIEGVTKISNGLEQFIERLFVDSSENYSPNVVDIKLDF